MAHRDAGPRLHGLQKAQGQVRPRQRELGVGLGDGGGVPLRGHEDDGVAGLRAAPDGVQQPGGLQRGQAPGVEVDAVRPAGVPVGHGARALHDGDAQAELEGEEVGAEEARGAAACDAHVGHVGLHAATGLRNGRAARGECDGGLGLGVEVMG